jgi:hypothetical protein
VQVSLTTLSRVSAFAPWELDGFAVPTLTIEVENNPNAAPICKL